MIFRKAKKVDLTKGDQYEAQHALDKANRAYREAEDNQEAVHEEASKLRKIRERNNFADMILSVVLGRG